MRTAREVTEGDGEGEAGTQPHGAVGGDGDGGTTPVQRQPADGAEGDEAAGCHDQRAQSGARGGERPPPFVVAGSQRIVGPHPGGRWAQPREGGVGEGRPEDALSSTKEPRQAEEGAPFVPGPFLTG